MNCWTLEYVVGWTAVVRVTIVDTRGSQRPSTRGWNSLGDPGTGESKSISMLLGKSSLCESRGAIHAWQTNRRHTIVTSSEPGRPKRPGETARQSFIGLKNTGKRYVDDSFRPLRDHLRASGSSPAGRTAGHSCCRQSWCIKTVSTTVARISGQASQHLPYR